MYTLSEKEIPVKQRLLDRAKLNRMCQHSRHFGVTSWNTEYPLPVDSFGLVVKNIASVRVHSRVGCLQTVKFVLCGKDTEAATALATSFTICDRTAMIHQQYSLRALRSYDTQRTSAVSRLCDIPQCFNNPEVNSQRTVRLL